MDNVEDRRLPLGVNFTLPSDENMTTNLKPGGKMVIKESIKNQIEKFKERVISFAELYEQYMNDNIAMINEITSRREWSDLTAEAKEKKKATALNDKKAEQDQTLRNRQATLEEDIDKFDCELTAELFKSITGSEKLKNLATKLGVSPELCNTLLEDVAGLSNATDILSSQNSYTDLILRKIMRDGGKDLSELQKNYANERINSEGSEDMQTYKYIKKMLGFCKNQIVFVADSNIRYLPDDLDKIQISKMVKDALEKSAV